MHPIIESNRPAIEALCGLHRVRRLEVFGSVVRDDFDPTRSDVDFLVEFDPAAEVSLFRDYLGLRAALSDLLARPVDLVMRSAIRNPYLREAIDSERSIVYAAG
jgi:predicted nucleotidyltransferase